MLTAQEREFLREAAWDSIRSALEERPPASGSPREGPLLSPGSAFVTLRAGGRLRGCIGMIGEKLPLAEAVRQASRKVLADPRFPPVTREELDGIELEISVLTPFRALESEEEPSIGRHGLYVEAKGRTGLLLPQVASEQGWDRETFLDHVCVKAGLAADEWRSGSAAISVFEAEVF